MSASAETSATPRWLHWWAVLTVCATLALLVLGSLVTTFRAGMADRYWPTPPLFILRADIIAEAERQGYAPFLFIIEHSHRAAGWFVGCCTIVLCLGLWLFDTRRSLKWLGTLALVGVSLQGVLGGMRVLLNDWLGTDLATLHGCFAQLVFALLAAVALLTSARWHKGPFDAVSPRLSKLALGVSTLVFVQVVLGAVVRHSHPRFAQRLHFLLAFAVFAAIFVLLRALREPSRKDRWYRWMGWALMTFLTFQILVGVEAWMMRFGKYVLPEQVSLTPGATVVRTLHFVFGTLLFTTTVLLVVLSRQRHPVVLTSPTPRPERVLEGVA